MATSFSDGRSRNTRRTTVHGQATGKLFHLRCESSVPFCNLQSPIGDRLVWVVRYSNYITHWATRSFFSGLISPLIEIMRSCKLFTHVSKMAILTYKRANSITVNNVMILNITHNIFNLDDTDVFIRSVILKSVDSRTII